MYFRYPGSEHHDVLSVVLQIIQEYYFRHVTARRFKSGELFISDLLLLDIDGLGRDIKLQSVIEELFKTVELDFVNLLDLIEKV